MAKVTMYQREYVDEIIVDNFSKRNVRNIAAWTAWRWKCPMG